MENVLENTDTQVCTAFMAGSIVRLIARTGYFTFKHALAKRHATSL